MEARHGAFEDQCISTAEMRRQSELLACQERERTRIAAELHDAIGSSLSAVKFELDKVVERIQVEAPHSGFAAEGFVADTVRKIILDLKGTIEEVRRIAMNLRPSILDDLGIVATIGWFCREFEGCYQGVHVVRQISVEEKDIPDSLKTTIFRILQEATNNAMKHGNANLIRITLSRKADEIRLAVEDNGKGFDISEVPAKHDFNHHFGIASMRQRAKCSGGSLVIKTFPGTGTHVFAVWPTTTCRRPDTAFESKM